MAFYPTIRKYGRTYHYYATYSNGEDLFRTIKRARHRTNTKYIIVRFVTGYVFPTTYYRLYFDKIIRMGL